MDQILDFRSLRRIAPVAAALAGVVVALLAAVIPSWRLEAFVVSTGLADHLTAASPPLGATARSALALASGGTTALAVWAVLTFAARRLPDREGAVAESDAPVLRRADAHPDAPARRPLRASEDLASTWGQPLPLGRVEAPASVPDAHVGERLVPRDVPVDLDTPLAAVDPAAIPDVPREPVRPVAALVRPIAEERIETFELTPIRRAPRTRPVTPEPASVSTSTSLAALLDRLEQGSARRVAHPAPPLSETLGMLRGLAAR